jgi:hypothetical protein
VTTLLLSYPSLTLVSSISMSQVFWNLIRYEYIEKIRTPALWYSIVNNSILLPIFITNPNVIPCWQSRIFFVLTMHPPITTWSEYNFLTLIIWHSFPQHYYRTRPQWNTCCLVFSPFNHNINHRTFLTPYHTICPYIQESSRHLADLDVNLSIIYHWFIIDISL